MLFRKVKRCVRGLFSQLDIYHALCFECQTLGASSESSRTDVEFSCMTAHEMRARSDPAMLGQLWWGDHPDFTIGYAALINGRIAAVAWTWTHEECQQRQDWQIEAQDVFLVEMFVSPDFRGRGLSPALYRFAMADLCSRGYRRIYGRAWYNHQATLGTLYKLGWKRIATTVHAVPVWGPELRFSIPRCIGLLPKSF